MRECAHRYPFLFAVVRCFMRNFSRPPSRPAAIGQALFVTFLWSTSWLLIKLGLHDLPALPFAGLHYWLAFAILLPFAVRSQSNRAALRELKRREWLTLASYGLLFVALTQGAQFMGLATLPAATVSLLLNLSPIVVALFGAIFLAEKPMLLQWLGVGIYAFGIIVYFAPDGLAGADLAGIGIVMIAVVANAASSVMGRHINKRSNLSPLLITTTSMGFGASALLAVGIAVQGLPHLTATHWLYICWLAAVNTSLAFPLWNNSLRTLTAVESSLINSTMLAQIALLAFVFLGEALGWQDLIGMVLVGIGALVVQLGGRTQLRPHKPR